MIGSSIAHYRIQSLLGEGGMGAVYRAFDTKLSREVAIKVLPPAMASVDEWLVRFTREAQLLASLNHPNIAAVYGIEERAIVMELVEGPTLAERIAAGALPQEEAIDIARQMAEALEAAHDKGVIHRDLKPANIKVTPGGQVKILDFGLAKTLLEDKPPTDPANTPTVKHSPTNAGIVMGTPGYMSPEQARGKPVDRRTDIWAFGVVLYEMLTGQALYTGETVTETLAAVMRDEPDLKALPASTHTTVRRLLARCLTKDPRSRLRDIGEARLQLEEFQRGGIPSEPSPVPAVAPQNSHSRLYQATSAILLPALIGVTLLYLRQPAPERSLMRVSLADQENNEAILSPDGKLVAFHSGGASFIRPLDSAQPKKILDTAMTVPFWSSDSRNIAYFRGNELFRVSSDGGSPVKICTAGGTARFGTWHEQIVLFGGLGTPIRRVSAAGGEPKPITVLNEAEGETSHVSPFFFPDGRHFLYSAMNRDEETVKIYATSLDEAGDLSKRVFIGQVRSNAQFVPLTPGASKGHLLFARNDTLFAQPFDGARLSSIGDPVPLADHIVQAEAYAKYYFTTSRNGHLLYRAATGEASQLAWLDRAGNLISQIDAGLNFASISLSPDGSTIAGDVRTGSEGVYVLDPERRTRMQISTRPAGKPVWSPDGKHLVYSSIKSGTTRAIYRKEASGAGIEDTLFEGQQIPRVTDWSRDGRWILFTQVDPKTSQDIWSLDLRNGNKPGSVANSEMLESRGVLSPDGRWLAYAMLQSATSDVYLQPFPPTGAKWLVKAAAGNPRWTKNGELIMSTRNALFKADIKQSPMPLAGPPVQLFSIEKEISDYDISPKGDRFLCLLTEGRGTIRARLILNWNAAMPQ
ncbi:MAG: protein kinase [Bryobacteraceae bacterium]